MVLGELHRGKFTHRNPPTLVKLPHRKSLLVKLSCGKFLRGTFTEENFPVFINGVFIHHLLKMKRELLTA